MLATAGSAVGARRPPPPAGSNRRASPRRSSNATRKGVVRVRREVRQNAEGDYVNHGAWRAWDADGPASKAKGATRGGSPRAIWCRWADAEECPQLASEPF